MLFQVLPVGSYPPSIDRSMVYLMASNWDDWFKFETWHDVVFFDKNSERHNLGGIKIGQFNMPKDQRRPILPNSFDKLDETFFSLGQDDSYYENLNKLGNDDRTKILKALRDMAFDLKTFERALGEDVTGISLLRNVTKATVRGQFHRIAHGGARLSHYEFSYTAGKDSKGFSSVFLSFKVEPESQPPTNVHVLIGRNGVGKTYLLNRMTRALVEDNVEVEEVGAFVSEEEWEDENLFANIVSVAFSAFDPFEPLSAPQNKSSGIQYSYIGLKRIGKSETGKLLPPKSHKALATEFSNSIKICCQGIRVERWRRTLEMLETDPIFKDAEVSELASLTGDELKKQASSLFGRLSSGHKIVLLTVTRLVETVEERTLVLLDEPEAHLHPPLLSAFVRALSNLLIDRNGVAIIATHSPVILQEVPKSCVWMLRRAGRKLICERPESETFGENVGVLTREVFDLEVTQAGFHKLLRESIKPYSTFESILDDFGGELGSEAQAIVRGLLAAHNLDEHD
jgi:ABC-type molybdenum transport system ATPase subunit/photorepair protein PhrA